MCNLDLEAFMRAEYAENPFLEEDDDARADNYWYRYRERRGGDFTQPGDLPDHSGESLRDMLLSQLNQSHYSAAEWGLICKVIDFLNPDGYLCCGAYEISEILGYSEANVERCLSVLSRLDPPGLFARDLPDCLIRQLRSKGEPDSALIAIIEHHLPDIAAGRFRAIAGALRLPLDAVKRYARIIHGLRPRPLEGFSTAQTHYAVPDLIIECAGGSWRVWLNDNEYSAFRVSETYLRMMDSADGEARDYCEHKLKRARFVLRCVEKRRQTLFSNAGAIAGAQQAFFLGEGVLQPMTLSDIAESAGLHVSTVSRAVSGKYMQTPRGLLPMKELFTAGASKAGNISSAAARDLLKRAVEAEDARVPLSDAELARVLAAHGAQVSRRTVTKYRRQMGIADSYSRVDMEGFQ
jgi:RNA polymerase sigma-54 factor